MWETEGRTENNYFTLLLLQVTLGGVISLAQENTQLFIQTHLNKCYNVNVLLVETRQKCGYGYR